MFEYLCCSDVISWPIHCSAHQVVSATIEAFSTCVLFCWYVLRLVQIHWRPSTYYIALNVQEEMGVEILLCALYLRGVLCLVLYNEDLPTVQGCNRYILPWD